MLRGTNSFHGPFHGSDPAHAAGRLDDRAGGKCAGQRPQASIVVSVDHNNSRPGRPLLRGGAPRALCDAPDDGRPAVVTLSARTRRTPTERLTPKGLVQLATSPARGRAVDGAASPGLMANSFSSPHRPRRYRRARGSPACRTEGCAVVTADDWTTSPGEDQPGEWQALLSETHLP